MIAGTTYYVKAYAVNAKGVAYGDSKEFTTLGSGLPEISTRAISKITANSAESGGEVTDIGGSPVTIKGICWSQGFAPTVENDTTVSGSGIGSFVSNLTGLKANSTYYLRAYVVNSSGMSYGLQFSFTTDYEGSLPELTTKAIWAITADQALSGGDILSDGGAVITSKGICWNKTGTPTANTTNKTNDGTGVGEFVSSIKGLDPNTSYFVRAYATNSEGTAYGEEVHFKTRNGGIYTDPRDGNKYEYELIGTQYWLTQNLSYLPSVSLSTSGPKEDKYYYVYGNSSTNIQTAKNSDNYKDYGVLYNLVAAIEACPEGWYLPSDEEWTVLVNFLGGFSEAGHKMKSTVGWDENGAGNNVSGFNVKPAGSRIGSGDYSSSGREAYFCTKTNSGSYEAYYMNLKSKYPAVFIGTYRKDFGFSVRCISY